MFLITPTLFHVFLAFVLFRFFDITKAFPAKLCEQRLPGGYGVVMDDVVAGIYANIALQVLSKIFNL
jgi:phosphatidylglycerophosphatase A